MNKVVTNEVVMNDAACTSTALDTARLEQGLVMSNYCYPSTPLGELVIQAPQCAATVQAGQFVHLALVDLDEHLLRRPFSVYKTGVTQDTITLLYQVVGEGTRHLRSLESGRTVDLIGPVGQGWRPPQQAERCLLVGGGVGVAPLYMLAGDLLARGAEVEVVMGASTAVMLACKESFARSLPADKLHITTDDGSVGFKGFTTERAQELMTRTTYDYLATCGPEPMQKAMAQLAAAAGIRCEVSLERRMACGIGACLSCVVSTQTGNKRACVDGPVFEAEEVVW